MSTEGFFAKGEVPWLLARETGALSVHFNPGTAQLGATAETADAPMSATWVGAFRIPITLPTRLGGPRARHFLRGVVAKDADTRIRFVLDVGGEKPLAGQMYAEEFPYGKSMDEQFVREFPFRPRVRGVGHYSGTVIVTIERRKPGARAELHLSSLDLATDPTDRGRKKGKSRGK
ncbi:MAG TPA: hypothetical protein VK422_10490 [Pyrinomonadaceae bacterium]|nr:hypothetical protein [Pyrinomonadaceae bacterium]